MATPARPASARVVVPQRSRLRLGLRLVAWLLPVAAWAAFQHATGEAREAVALAEGLERLAAGDPETAAARFEALMGSAHYAARAQAGLRLASALAGRSASDAPRSAETAWLGAAHAAEPAAAPDALGVSLVGLLEQTLRAGRFDACHDLARLAHDARASAGWLYLAAARLERGDDDGARALIDEAPALFEGTALGRAVLEGLEWRARGARTLVRDRRGVLLGALDVEGTFVPRDAAAAACVPSAVLTAAARAGDVRGLRLALDARLCALAYDALGARRGSIVLLDARTGALRAAVSDERTRRREPEAAFTQSREPASTAKLITTTAALRAGIDPDAFLRERSCHGSQRYGDGTLWCPARAVPLGGLTRALAVSCNVAFADLAQELGRDALVAEYRRYGFALGDAAAGMSWAPAGDADDAHAGDVSGHDDEAPQTIDDVAEPDVPDAEARVLVAQGDARQLADLAIGLQDVAVTPLYGARFAAVFAYGSLPEVALIEAHDGVLGRSPRALRPPAATRVLEPAWLPRLWPAMSAVAEWGTAAGVAPSDFPVAMKSGTASQWHVGYHCNHLGVGPLPAPVLAFSVRVTHQPRSFAAVQAAREVSARLLSGLAELRRAGAL